MSFRFRLALFLVVTLAAVQVLTAMVAYSYLRTSLVDRAKAELASASVVVRRQLEMISGRISEDVRVLSLDYALRQAIAQQDFDTELSALRNHGRRVGATRMMLVGLDGRIAADTGAPQASGRAFGFPELLEGSRSAGERTSLATLKGRIYWMVVVPVRAPVAIAFIAAWIPVDNAVLQTLSGLSDMPLSIALASRGAGGRWAVQARTASGPRAFPLPASQWQSESSQTVDDGDRGEFFAVTTPLRTVSRSQPVVAIIAYRIEEVFSAYRSVVIPVLFFFLLALVLAAGGSMLLVRRAARPLETLAATAKRIARGDYRLPPQLATQDEIGQLAGALGHMTKSIADREASLNAMIGELEIARNEAVKANEAKSQFLANMSHELRTPLNAIVGFGEMLHQEILGPLGVARYREYAGDILQSGQRLLGLVSRMLDLAEVEAGKLTIERRPVAPLPILQQAVASIRAEAKRAGVALSTAGDGAVSPDIDGDAAKLRQAFSHILQNAVKFTPAGGEVKVRSQYANGEIRISIEDTGIGMSKADLDVVTRPFHRLRSALDGQHQGAGLGLPFAKAIIELHGGTLGIESAVGTGTRIGIRFPMPALAMSDAA